jgi:hypothetical protein
VHQKLNDSYIAHPKVKVTILYFSPKASNPERLYGVKIMKIRAWQSHTWAPLKYDCNDIFTWQYKVEKEGEGQEGGTKGADSQPKKEEEKTVSSGLRMDKGQR